MTAADPAAYFRARYARFLAAGTCTTCGAERAPHDPRLCLRHRKVHRAADKASRERLRAESVPRTAGHRDGIACKKCLDMAHRRPAAGCSRCGRPHGEDTLPPLQTRQDAAAWELV